MEGDNRMCGIAEQHHLAANVPGVRVHRPELALRTGGEFLDQMRHELQRVGELALEQR